jgi:hypothetical protein
MAGQSPKKRLLGTVVEHVKYCLALGCKSFNWCGQRADFDVSRFRILDELYLYCSRWSEQLENSHVNLCEQTVAQGTNYNGDSAAV